MPLTPRILAHKLRTDRLMAGLTQEAAAAAVGCTRQAIDNWEASKGLVLAVRILDYINWLGDQPKIHPCHETPPDVERPQPQGKKRSLLSEALKARDRSSGG